MALPLNFKMEPDAGLTGWSTKYEADGSKFPTTASAHSKRGETPASQWTPNLHCPSDALAHGWRILCESLLAGCWPLAVALGTSLRKMRTSFPWPIAYQHRAEHVGYPSVRSGKYDVAAPCWHIGPHIPRLARQVSIPADNGSHSSKVSRLILRIVEIDAKKSMWGILFYVAVPKYEVTPWRPWLLVAAVIYSQAQCYSSR